MFRLLKFSNQDHAKFTFGLLSLAMISRNTRQISQILLLSWSFEKLKCNLKFWNNQQKQFGARLVLSGIYFAYNFRDLSLSYSRSLPN